MSEDKSKKKSRKGIWLIISGLVVIAAVTGVVVSLLGNKTTDSVALKVGAREVSESQLADYVESGKASNANEKSVRNTVVEYEKNKQLAVRYGIDIPEQYILWLSKRSSDVPQTEKMQLQTEAAPDAYRKLLSYNMAFASRVAETRYNGRGIFLYEIAPQSVQGDDSNFTQAKKLAEEAAKKYHSSILKNAMTPEQVLSEVRARNTQDGLNGESGVQFVQEYTGSKDDIWMGNLNSAAYIYETLKDKQVGLSDIQMTQRGSAWFAYILYTQKAQPGLASKIAADKANMKVVVYDEQ